MTFTITLALRPWMRYAGAGLVGFALGLSALLLRGCDPKPPGPPVPPVPPGPVAGLRVLVVYESAELSKLSKGQLAGLTGAAVRQYLTAHCAKGSDGKTPEFRFFDKDTDLSAESPAWRELMARPRPSVPWLVVQNGAKVAESPLPDDLLAALQKIGGP